MPVQGAGDHVPVGSEELGHWGRQNSGNLVLYLWEEGVVRNLMVVVISACALVGSGCAGRRAVGISDSAGSSDGRVSDLVVPDAKMPDLVVPDAKVPDLNLPDAGVPDLTPPDAKVSLPDFAILVEPMVSAGWWHTCEVTTGKKIKCWGDNTTGQSTPPLGTFIQVSAGWWHTCGITTGNVIKCWGDNSDGQSKPP